MKAIIFSLISLVCFNNYLCAQTVVKAVNGSIVACNAIIVDPDSCKGKYQSGQTILTISSNLTNNRLKFQIDTFILRNISYDKLLVYDGNTTNSTSLLAIFNVSNSNGSVISTSNTITLKFDLAPSSNDQDGFIKCRISCFGDSIINKPKFQTVQYQIGNGSIDIEDYDKDGDKDALIGGQIMRNDSYYDSLFVVKKITNVLNKNWTNVKFLSADFNNDGFKDIFITGSNNAWGGFDNKPAIYRNNGDNTFTLITTANFAKAYKGVCSIVDFNKDGKLDICYQGIQNLSGAQTTIFKVYYGNNNFGFTDANIVLPGITNNTLLGRISWADCDNDGDNDLLICGYDLNANWNKYAYLYINNNGTMNQSVLYFGTPINLHWNDINKDGKMDIVKLDNISPTIYMNQGTNIFASIPNNLPSWGVYQSWFDYDRDNDLDLAVTGLTGEFGIFRNDGNGVFVAIKTGFAKGSKKPSWVKINGDESIDVFLNGYSIWNKENSFYLKNMGADSFKVASYPLPISDGDNFSVEDFNNDGIPDVLMIGGQTDIECEGTENSLLLSGQQMQYLPIPYLKMVLDLKIKNPNLHLSHSHIGYWRWGDYDNDGISDIILTNNGISTYGHSYSVIFKNFGRDSFSVVFNSLTTPLVFQGSQIGSGRITTLVDLDNDGVNELHFLPNTVFKRSGNSWINVYGQISCLGFSGTGDCKYWYVDVGDFDNDGFKDMLVASEVGLEIFRNNHSNALVQYFFIRGNFNGQVKWFDLDKDGDLDIVTPTGIIENKKGSFIFIRNSNFSECINVCIADFNKDGNIDLLTQTGFPSPSPKVAFNYGFKNNLFFNYEIDSLLFYGTNSQPWYNEIAAFDIDNDGDDDIIHTQINNCKAPSILMNLYNYQFKNIHLISGNGIEKIPINSLFKIKWYGNKISASVSIKITIDGGVTWQTITTNAISSKTGGSYDWRVSSPVSNLCKFVIFDNADISLIDSSDNYFEITGILSNKNFQFELNKSEFNVQIKWNYSFNTFVKQFIIQKSYDGLNFVNLSYITKHKDPSYSFIDTINSNKNSKSSYYRIIANHLDNSKETSITKMLKFERNLMSLSAYPNPTKGILNLELGDFFESKQIQIMDIFGKILYHKKTNDIEHKINVKSLVNGIYFIRVTKGEQLIVQKIIVSN